MKTKETSITFVLFLLISFGCDDEPSVAYEQDGDGGELPLGATSNAGVEQAGTMGAGVKAGTMGAGVEAGMMSAGTEVGMMSAGTEAGMMSAGTEAGMMSAGTEAGTMSAGTEAGTMSAGTEAGTMSAGTEAGTMSAGTEAGTMSAGTEAGTMSAGTEAGTTSAGAEAGMMSAGSEAGMMSAGTEMSGAPSLEGLRQVCTGSSDCSSGQECLGWPTGNFCTIPCGYSPPASGVPSNPDCPTGYALVCHVSNFCVPAPCADGCDAGYTCDATNRCQPY